MKKIISIIVSILLTVVVFAILHITKILVYNTLITYYISFAILLAMFLILFLGVFNTNKNNTNKIPSVNSTFNTIKKENTQTINNTDVLSQKENFDLSPSNSVPSQSTPVQEAPSVQDNVAPEVPKPEYNTPPVQEASSVQDSVVSEVPRPESTPSPVQEKSSQQETKNDLPYTDIFGNTSKPVEKSKPVENAEVQGVPKQNLDVTNFPKDNSEDKGKKLVPLSTFKEISKDEE